MVPTTGVNHASIPLRPRFAALASTISAVLGTGHADTAAAQDAPEGVIEEVRVTGSRIVRRDFEAASPIMTLDTQRFESSSTLSMESVLNQMPQFVPAGTQFVSGTQGSPTVSLGIASVNLRGIGTNRTLVLVDGRRPQPANAALVVDVNTIPAAAIQRVETITGGASAVYGADALAGVVNFILKEDFEGVELDFQSGITAEGDGEESRFTTLIGMNADDGRGNVMLGVEWYNREIVWQRDRDFYMEGWYDPQTTAGGFLMPAGFSFGAGAPRPTQEAVDAVFAEYGIAPGTVNVSADPDRPVVNEIYFNPDGSPFILQGAVNYRGPMGSTERGYGFAGMRLNPNGNLGQVFFDGIASTPLERRSAFGKAFYRLTDNLTAFAQVNYSNVEVTTNGGYPPAITVWQASIPADDREIPPALRTLLESRQRPIRDPDTGEIIGMESAADESWNLFRVIDFYGAPQMQTTTNDVYQIMAGLEGSLPNRDWTWEAYVSTGETETLNAYMNLPSLQRYQSLVAQPNFGQGTFPFGRNYGLECPTGLPIFFGQGGFDPRCLESIDSKARATSRLTQNVLEANLQGGLAELPAGELRFAAGASYRENTFRFDPLNDDVSIADHPIGLFASNNTLGETDVAEVYGELLVPASQRLEFELGYRYSDYSLAIGEVSTYKALFDWSATDRLRLRGGYQVANRAPNTAELFQGPLLLVVPFGPSDPCQHTTLAPWGNRADNPNRLAVQELCFALIGNPDTPFGVPGSDEANTFERPGAPFFPLEIEIQRGDPNVKSEEAKTWTFGVVLNGVGRFENLTASFDLYDIEITDVIAPINSLFVYQKCFNADGASNPTLDPENPFCQMIGRNPTTGEREQVDAPFTNAGILETSGVDVQISWGRDIGPGSLSISSVATVLNEYKRQDAPGEPATDFKGTLAEGGQFDYRLNTTFGYTFGGGRTTLGLQWRHLPEVEDAAKARSPDATVLGVGSYDMFDFFGRFDVNERMTLRAGIDNLFDKEPPIVGSDPNNPANPNRNAANTNANYYDVLGRRAYLGLKMAF